MTAQTKDQLKALFETGDTLTESSFVNLIDSLLDIAETSSQTVQGPIAFSNSIAINGAITASAATSGQLFIGGAGNTMKLATLTAGSNINITNNDGGISIACPAATGGNLVLLSTQNASTSASIAFDSTLLTGTYNDYLLIIENAIPATLNATLELFFSTNNGSGYITGSCYSHLSCPQSNSNLYVGISNAAADFMQISATTSGSTSTSYSGFVNILSISTLTKVAGIGAVREDNTHGYQSTIGGYVINGSAINNIKLQMSSGNITSGKFKLYGIL